MSQDITMYSKPGGILTPIDEKNPLHVSTLGVGRKSQSTTILASGLGATTAGALSFSIQNIGVADGLIDGVVFAPATGITEEGFGSEIDPLTYDATGTTFVVSQLLLLP